MKIKLSVIALMIGLSLTGCAFEEAKAETAAEIAKEETISYKAELARETQKVSADEAQGEVDMVQPVRKKSTEDYSDVKIEELIKGQSLENKVSQLFVVTPEALLGGNNQTEAGAAAESKFQEFPVSGIIYMGKNLEEPEQTKKLLSDLQSCSRSYLGLPLFQSVDEEGGMVSRIASNASYGVKNVGNMADIGKSADTRKALESGEYVGSYLSELGFNLDYAPVADVITVSGNKLMEKRSFGSDRELVSEMALSFSKGLKSEGILSCAKHFPGHGNTVEDSHKGYAVSDKSLAELDETELKPFQTEIDNGISMIMVGHISLPKVIGDMTPSSLSPKIVQVLLRGKMGYKGVVITDAMNMGAVVNHYSGDEAAVLAIEAGCDLILAPVDMKSSRNAIIQAVKNGRISEERIDESLKRIYRLKLSI